MEKGTQYREIIHQLLEEYRAFLTESLPSSLTRKVALQSFELPRERSSYRTVLTLP